MPLLFTGVDGFVIRDDILDKGGVRSDALGLDGFLVRDGMLHKGGAHIITDSSDDSDIDSNADSRFASGADLPQF